MKVESINCKKCGSLITQDWRRDRVTIKKQLLVYCSRNCSNSRGARSIETKRKISKTLKKTNEINPRVCKSTYIEQQCSICGNNYTYKAGYPKMTCSAACTSYKRSINRQKYLCKYGNFSTKREQFEYKNVKIEVDSNLEKAGIVYLVDNLNATKIERYINLLNYWEGDVHRTYNPDFICMINGKTCIVEIKQLWCKKSKHQYNRTIPYKQKVLQKFCKEKNYNMLWIDFETTPILRKIYKTILNSR